jgi:hypothetical protein
MMRKILPLVLVMGLAGCAGAPLMSSGLSAEPSVATAEALPEPTALPPARPVQRVARRKSTVHVAAPKAAVDPAASPDDEPADRAARALDREANRLDSAARQVTNSICRGC